MGVDNPLTLARAQELFAAIGGVSGDFTARIFRADQPGFFRRDQIGFQTNALDTFQRISVDSDGPYLQARKHSAVVQIYDGLFLPENNPIFETDIKVSALSEIAYSAGFADAGFNDIISFYYDTSYYSDPNWHVVWNAWSDDIELNAANSLDGNAHPPNNSAFEKLRIEITSGTSINFYIDDVLVYTATTNINTLPLPAQLSILSFSASFRELYFRHVLARQSAFS